MVKFMAVVALGLGSATVPPPDLPPPAIDRGIWSQYNRGPTEAQIWYHQEVTGLLRDPWRYDGFIARLSCDEVGQDAWIRIGEDPQWQHVFVFDCSGHASTTRWMREAGIIGELGYYLARENGVPVGRGVRGAITFTNPYLHEGVHDLHYRTRYLRMGHPVPR